MSERRNASFKQEDILDMLHIFDILDLYLNPSVLSPHRAEINQHDAIVLMHL